MKVLFISTSDVHLKNNGGELCTNRNYLSFCELVGKENVSVVNLMETIHSGLKNAIKKRLNYFSGFYEGMSRGRTDALVKLAKEHDVVFINTSIHGKFAEQLFKSNYQGKIISFFHNVEYNIKLERARQKPWRPLEIFVIRHNEKMACLYSHDIIALNERDANELKRIYNVREVAIIPISLQDTYDGKISGKTEVPPSFLFAGNNWYANIHGIKWFIDNVLDHVDIKLQITGHKMDRLKSRFDHPKVQFLGFVNDLPAILKAADWVLLPIFKGSGMKVKTCEALMYGKNIIGTTESFEGYNIRPEKIGAVCNTREEFIHSINNLASTKKEKFNTFSRNYFLKNYSFEATLKSFKGLLN